MILALLWMSARDSRAQEKIPQGRVRTLRDSVLAMQENVRTVRDSVGFCWDRTQMGRLMKYLGGIEKEKFSSEGLIGGISPHDDYLYAARVYFPLFRMIRTKEAVIFGVTHRSVRQEIGEIRDVIVLDTHPLWRNAGPPVEPSPLREYLRRNLDVGVCVTNDRAQELEHSIEALVPFLAWYNPGVRITPIMVTAMGPGRMDTVSTRLAAAIAGYMREKHLAAGKDIFFLISSDANHYGADFNNIPYGADAAAHEEGTRNDRRIARETIEGEITEGKIARLSGELQKTLWCGRYSVPFGLATIARIMKLAESRGIRGKLLRYSDTYTEGVIPLKNSGMGTTAPFSLKHWVGFLSAGIYAENRGKGRGKGGE